MGRTISISPSEVRPRPLEHTIVVLVGGIHRGVVDALDYARSLRPDHLAALYVTYDEGDRQAMEKQWKDFGFEVPLEIVNSPYWELVDVVMHYLDELDARWENDTITVVIPEFVVGRLFSPAQLLHNQSAAALKLALLFCKGTSSRRSRTTSN